MVSTRPLVSSIVTRHADRRVEDKMESPAWWPRIHSFCIGLDGAPDLENARLVAEFLGTAHHEYIYTVQEGLDALSDVIYHIETYDVTTVRASTPMYLMARKIKAMGVKMVFTGEGADEIFGGYLYFHKAPNPRGVFRRDRAQGHQAQPLRLPTRQQIHGGVGRRGARAVPRQGVSRHRHEHRSGAQDVESGTRNGSRNTSCAHPSTPRTTRTCPESVLWRQKEQFSDGVGYGWIDGLKDHAESQISDAMFEAAPYRFPGEHAA